MFLVKYNNNLSRLMKYKKKHNVYLFYIDDKKCVVGKEILMYEDIEEIYKLNKKVIRIKYKNKIYKDIYLYYDNIDELLKYIKNSYGEKVEDIDN